MTGVCPASPVRRTLLKVFLSKLNGAAGIALGTTGALVVYTFEELGSLFGDLVGDGSGEVDGEFPFRMPFVADFKSP